MEVLQAIVYTTRYVFRNGNLDWYYLLAVVMAVMLLFSKRYKKYVKPILIFTLLLLLMECGSIFLVDIIHAPGDMITYMGKLALCVILMFGTIEYFPKFRINKFLYCAITIHAIETIIALVSKSEFMWRTKDVINKFYETRLQLLYLEPSELSMCSALLMILLVYLIEQEGFHYLYIVGFGILSLDMYLSAGMGGILALGVAIGTVLLYKALEQAVTKKKFYLMGVLLCLGIGAIIFVYGTNFPIAQRTRLILGGELFADNSTTWRLLIPMRAIGPLLFVTKFAGVGFGNFNAETTWPILAQAYGTRNWFPNSFLYFIAEGGILAIIILILGICYLGYRTYRSKSIGKMLLFVFLVIYQIPGGYFTNPLNWICYGFLLSDMQERTMLDGYTQ